MPCRTKTILYKLATENIDLILFLENNISKEKYKQLIKYIIIYWY